MVIIPLPGVTWLFGDTITQSLQLRFYHPYSTQVRILSNDFVNENIHIKCPEIIYS